MGHLHFSDFAEEEHLLEGEKKKLDEILNIEILITGYRISDSRYKERKYITMQYKKKGEEYITFTGSEVLQKQIKKYITGNPKISEILAKSKRACKRQHIK